MASLAAIEPGLSPGTLPKEESVVPVSIFAPDCGDDLSGGECFEDGENVNGESEDHLDFTSKLTLVSPTGEQYDSLLRQLRERMDEGCGETIYVVGVGSDGGDYGLDKGDMEASVATVQSLCEQIEADMILLRERSDAGGKVRDYLIRRRVGEEDFLEVRVAVVGNVDAGKSTLLGVLTHGELDNGRGFARQKLFRHKHEMESGRTSSVGNDILGFDQEGHVVNKPDNHGGSLDWTKICERSSKVITFIDLAGHEKYLKTTVFGMTGHLPDFCMLMVGSNAGIVGMTKEHLGLALALNVPVFVVVTKIDMCPANILAETLHLLQRLLKSPGCRKIPVLVQNKDDVIVTASNFSSERMCPIFQVSNVTGENMDLLKMFLNLLSSKTSYKEDEPAEFQIDDTYSVPGVGTVVSGTTLRGLIRLNDTLLLGPDPLGSFLSIAVKSIHRKRMPVKEVRGGQTASFALKKIKRSSIRKGMVMISPRLTPQATWEFMAEILVLHHPTTISPRYQAMVHCGSIRQTATILTMNRDCLRTGDKASVHFRFIKTPEYLHTDQRLVFREGRTKAVGTITKLLQSVTKAQQAKMQSTKKGTTSANEEAGSAPRPDSPNAGQLPPKAGGGGRRRGGQRHRGKALNSTASPTSQQHTPAAAGVGTTA
ncbi:GTP-binding protein 1-like isoform X1 [Salvelinus namaycush]|uniref:GTP-binding protein 1 n=1 Tax=Salvelinus namaycush TaxID=8040 RepID=A0A8U0QGT5_SALNM|nr:GTP-binding protein 1-like isoform X1 [Salvelinus namaycush]XP_038839595.1 GTP-binding protein 1-like isoform X1 [Salvelinus namaycush]XP_038839596.1 GTP-binding protein 1-like isoform X1 [Salvelinus namaycush]XP_038839597.1 GTP-binding protein 1-like isoform X1 [Salvelinus namaycush]XP_038841606.1 GTP-binding protein 1-like isoform X1 [Salvelinus namaycush]XP_038841607.1 GTP-binding protein 1-like isoform X1 [Salvelinus namaycush]XP_038841608.1 GTP-binding protein 1-like isoform X1 [Salve